MENVKRGLIKKPKKETKSRLDLAGAEKSALDLRGFFW
jgi:hypothetical protein